MVGTRFSNGGTTHTVTVVDPDNASGIAVSFTPDFTTGLDASSDIIFTGVEATLVAPNIHTDAIAPDSVGTKVPNIDSVNAIVDTAIAGTYKTFLTTTDASPAVTFSTGGSLFDRRDEVTAGDILEVAVASTSLTKYIRLATGNVNENSGWSSPIPISTSTGSTALAGGSFSQTSSVWTITPPVSHSVDFGISAGQNFSFGAEGITLNDGAVSGITSENEIPFTRKIDLFLGTRGAATTQSETVSGSTINVSITPYTTSGTIMYFWRGVEWDGTELVTGRGLWTNDLTITSATVRFNLIG